MLLVHLPDGPTAHFRLSSLVLGKDIKVAARAKRGGVGWGGSGCLIRVLRVPRVVRVCWSAVGQAHQGDRAGEGGAPRVRARACVCWGGARASRWRDGAGRGWCACLPRTKVAREGDVRGCTHRWEHRCPFDGGDGGIGSSPRCCLLTTAPTTDGITCNAMQMAVTIACKCMQCTCSTMQPCERMRASARPPHPTPPHVNPLLLTAVLPARSSTTPFSASASGPRPRHQAQAGAHPQPL